MTLSETFGGPASAVGDGVSNPTRTGGTAVRNEWRRRYVTRLLMGDAAAAMVGGLVGYVWRFGDDQTGAVLYSVPAWSMVAFPFVWVLLMLVGRAYEKRFLWTGPEEFRRVLTSSMTMLATVGTVSWAFKLELARGFVVIALPLAAFLTLVVRYLLRSHVHGERAQGKYMQTTLLVGHRNGVEALHRQITRRRYQGFEVIGCCVPAGAGKPDISFDGIPVLGGLPDVVSVVQQHGVDTVAVLPSPELDGPALRRLGWELEDTSAELLLAPAVTEIAGPRVNIRPVCGLPLMHVERPELTGVRRLTKSLFDRLGAAFVLLLTLPVLVTVAVAIKVTSRGPVFFRQERVGLNGRRFHMLKFRSMVVGAHAMVTDLAAQNEGNGVLFKMRSDPRVTSVGRVLRRYSIDELPQLINVLRGEMSLVGPRPPLESEVERYGRDMHRRFLVKPGITGLWQISGRSDLSWDDSVRIDVRYVEGWSLMFDFMILWKTVGAVFRGSGAY